MTTGKFPKKSFSALAYEVLEGLQWLRYHAIDTSRTGRTLRALEKKGLAKSHPGYWGDEAMSTKSQTKAAKH